MLRMLVTFLFLEFLMCDAQEEISYPLRQTGRVTFPLRDVVQTIDLGTSGLRELYIPTGGCKDVSDGRIILVLPHIGLRKLYVGIIESSHVSCLSLQNNLIDHVDRGTFDRLPNLMYLDLSQNRIPYCDLLTFGGHHLLRSLILDMNEPPGSDVGRIIIRADYFPNLEHLYLRKNSMAGLEFSLKRYFPRLSHLYLSDNLITSEGFAMDVPLTLTHLHLERNRIYRFSGEIMRTLHSLFLDENRLRALCYEACESSSLSLRGAWTLKVLSLSKNDLVTIERDAFRDACNLTTLNLAHNRIEVIQPGTFDYLLSLKDLSLRNNRLRTIPDMSHMTLLTSLALSYNQIDVVPIGSICNLPLLKWLSMGDNQIYRIEAGSLAQLSSLEDLDLSNNRLETLPAGWLTPQVNLRQLNVRGNRFTCLEHLHIDVAPLLTSIYMQNNFVKYVGVRDFAGMSRDVVVYLENECKVLRNPCYDLCDEQQRYTERITSDSRG